MEPEDKPDKNESRVFIIPSLPFVDIFKYKQFQLFRWLYYLGWTVTSIYFATRVFVFIVSMTIPKNDPITGLLMRGLTFQGILDSFVYCLTTIVVLEAMRLIISCLAMTAFEFKE